MTVSRFALCVFSVLALSACTNTWEGMKADARDSNQWAHNQPSHLEETLGPAPQGYTGLSKGQPPRPPQLTRFESDDGWQPLVKPNDQSTLPDVNEQGAYEEPLPDTRGRIQYDDVSVFPVDGDETPYQENRYDYVAKKNTSAEGDLVKKIYFAYGSARIGSGDRAGLDNLAAGLAGNYRVDVVGHASKRVDGVTDPLQKKLINLKMSQKRANAVTLALRGAGVKPSWIEMMAHGDEEPNDAPKGKAQEAADRRVEIFVDNQ